MSNEQKTPITRTLPKFVAKKISDEISRRGKALPGHVVSVSGPIVTVNFDVTGIDLPNVQMPLFGPEYIRYPIQAGDKGVCFPVDVYTGGVTGLGGGTADTTPRGNLSTLVWFPVGNKDWSAVDTQAVTIYGPNGVVMRDTNSGSVVTLTPSGITVESSGTAKVQDSSNNIQPSAMSVTWTALLTWLDTHTHSGVTSGGGTSGPPSSPAPTTDIAPAN